MDENNPFPKEPPQFHKKKQSQEQADPAMTQNITSLGTRLRVLEEQYTSLRNKIRLTDSNMLDFEKDVRTEIKSMSEDLVEVKRSLQELVEKINVIASELGSTVKEHEFKVVEKYIDLWNPSRFVTKEQLLKKIEEEKKKH